MHFGNHSVPFGCVRPDSDSLPKVAIVLDPGSTGFELIWGSRAKLLRPDVEAGAVRLAVL